MFCRKQVSKVINAKKLYVDTIITFVTAFSLIVYEVFLTRFFAAIMDYNYVFLVVSLATLGIGIGGFLSYSRFSFRINVIHLSALYAISIATIVFSMYVFSFIGILLYAGMALFPFLLGGLLLASLMQRQHDNIGFMYFSDLTGAGFGAIASVILMNAINPLQTINLISLLAFAVIFLVFFGLWTRKFRIIWGTVLAALVINFIYPVHHLFPFKAFETSPHNVFLDEKEAGIIYTHWNAFSRTDVFDADDDDLLYITIDGGAVSPISKFKGDLSDVDYLRNTTGYLAFQDGNKNRALIIGAAGGQEVLIARATGFKEIEAVDINEGSFQAVSKVSNFSGDVFNMNGVKPIVSDGRNYIRETKNKYDLIYLSLVKKNSENGFGLSLMENYIFTQEAISEYLNKLTNSGKLGFLVHDEVELYKIMYAAENELRKQGIAESDLSNHLVVVGTYQHLGHVVEGLNGSNITRPLLLIRNQPFEVSEAANLLSSIRKVQQIPVHIPYVYDQYQKMNILMNNGKVNLASNRDDMPFFYSKAVGLSPKLLMLIGFVLILALWMARMSRLPKGLFVYFSAIAIGFMMVEVTLIQRLVLPLGHPTLSFVLVLGVLLVSGGAGSYYSDKWIKSNHNRYLPLLVTGILIWAINTGIDWYNAWAVQMSLSRRILAVGLALVPLGFFMGTLFPYGLSRVAGKHIAACWGLNGIVTVAGSLLATVVSFTWGFSYTMTVGAVIYLTLFFIQPKLKF